MQLFGRLSLHTACAIVSYYKWLLSRSNIGGQTRSISALSSLSMFLSNNQCGILPVHSLSKCLHFYLPNIYSNPLSEDEKQGAGNFLPLTPHQNRITKQLIMSGNTVLD